MCTARSPGSRFFRLSANVTPEPLLFSVIVAVPTFWPFASRNSTTTGRSAAHTAAVPTRATMTPTIPTLVTLSSYAPNPLTNSFVKGGKPADDQSNAVYQLLWETAQLPPTTQKLKECAHN